VFNPANIRHRLTLSYLAAFTIILVIFILGATGLEYLQLTRQMVHAEIEDLETAEGLLYFDRDGQLTFNQRYHNPPPSRLLSDRYMEVLARSGQVLFHNDKLGNESLGGDPLSNEGVSGYNQRTLSLVDGTRLIVISHVHTINGIPILIRFGYSLGPVWRRVGDFALLLLSALPFALLFAGFFGYRIATEALRPLNEMASQVTTMTASNLSERLSVGNPNDELGHMAGVINGLLHRLEGAFENLKPFTSDASHELRTPLASMRSVGEVALQHQRSQEEYRDIIGSMLEEGTRLTATVDALLSMSRADAGRVEIDASTFPAIDLVKEVVGLFEPLAEEKGQSIEVEGDGKLSIQVDRLLINRALANILENAIKYAPMGTSIKVVIQHAASFVEVAVHDQGTTIDESLRLKVFDRFFRIDSSRSRDAGGNGLGLSIAKWAVEANGGTIVLAPGNLSGNVFTLRLPMVASAC
jgi:heavy metal sensor kinase